MTQEENAKAFEQALDNAWKDYIDRGAATVDALEENTQELAFAKGFKAGHKQAIEHPTGGELLHVLNKGCEQGYNDAARKIYWWLENHNDYQRVLDNGAGVRFDMEQCIMDLKKFMEQQ